MTDDLARKMHLAEIATVREHLGEQEQTTPLRDRIAAALYDHSHPGWAISFPDLDQEQRDTYLARADAVLAVLPATVDRAALVRACASFVRDTYSGEWADDAAATLERDADKIERGEPCSLLRHAAVLPATTNHDTDTSAGPVDRAEFDALVADADRLRRDGAALHAQAVAVDEQLAALRKQVAAPVDRAAVLREEADRIDATRADFPIAVQNGITWATAELRRHAAELRRVADETAATETQAHEPLRQWRVEILDGDEWMPASGLRRDRAQAVDQLQVSSAQRPLWNDGTKVQRRLVRETTTYTVEQPAAGARQDGAQP